MADRSYTQRRTFSGPITGLAQVVNTKPYEEAEKMKFLAAADKMETIAKKNKELFDMAGKNDIVNLRDKNLVTQEINEGITNFAKWQGENPYYEYDPNLMAKSKEYESKITAGQNRLRGQQVDAEHANMQEWLKKNQNEANFYEYAEDVALLGEQYKNYQATGSIYGDANQKDNPDHWFKFTPPSESINLDTISQNIAKTILADGFERIPDGKGGYTEVYKVKDGDIKGTASAISTNIGSKEYIAYEKTFKKALNNPATSAELKRKHIETLEDFIYDNIVNRVKDTKYNYDDAAIQLAERNARKGPKGSGGEGKDYLAEYVTKAANEGITSIPPQYANLLLANDEGNINIADFHISTNADINSIDMNRLKPINYTNAGRTTFKLASTGRMLMMEKEISIKDETTGKIIKKNARRPFIEANITATEEVGTLGKSITNKGEIETNNFYVIEKRANGQIIMNKSKTYSPEKIPKDYNNLELEYYAQVYGFPSNRIKLSNATRGTNGLVRTITINGYSPVDYSEASSNQLMQKVAAKTNVQGVEISGYTAIPKTE